MSSNDPMRRLADLACVELSGDSAYFFPGNLYVWLRSGKVSAQSVVSRVYGVLHETRQMLEACARVREALADLEDGHVDDLTTRPAFRTAVGRALGKPDLHKMRQTIQQNRVDAALQRTASADIDGRIRTLLEISAALGLLPQGYRPIDAQFVNMFGLDSILSAPPDSDSPFSEPHYTP